MSSKIRLAACLACLVFGSSLRADVIEIGVVANGADFATINAAVAAADDGDTLLVTAPGPYLEALVLDGRSLTIAADDGVSVQLVGSVEIRNVDANSQLILSGIDVRGTSAKAHAVRVSDCAGPVLLQDCELKGLPNFNCITYGEGLIGYGQTALLVRDSDHVIVQDSQLMGGQGAGGVVDNPCYVGGRGGHGLDASQSSVQLIECIVSGGRGGTNIGGESLGGDGGSGVSITDLQLITAASTITGGAGGEGVDFFPIEGYGNGGPGVHAMGANHARLFDTALAGGAAGVSSLGIPGDPGAPSIQDGATFFEIAVPSSTTSVSDRVVREGEVLGVTITGTPGDLLLVFADTGLDPVYLQNYYGTFMASLPTAIGPLTLGTIPGSGVRNLALPVPELGVDALTLVFQPVLLDGPGQIQISTSRTVLLLDAGL